MVERIDPGHESKRQTMTILGIILIIAGGILLIVGITTFAQPFTTSSREFFADPDGVMDRNSSAGFGGIAMIGLGGFAAMIGISLLTFANRGKIARYQAGEIAPVAKDTFNYVAKESSEGVKHLAGAIAEGVRSSQSAPPNTPKEVVKVKCRSCGYLESEDAVFCSSCGKQI